MFRDHHHRPLGPTLLGVCCLLLLTTCALSQETTTPPDAPAQQASAENSSATGGERQADADSYYRLFSSLADAIAQVEENYVEPIEREKIFAAAIRGVMRELDPYSNYIDAQHFQEFQEEVESEFGGVGMQVSQRDDRLTVISPLVGTPAYKAGIQAGDRILEIDGESTDDMSLADAVSRMKGPSGSVVEVTIARRGERQPIKLEIARDRIHVDTVFGWTRGEDDRWRYLLDGEPPIGYVRLDSFSRETASDLRRALGQLKAAGMQGLVLDLRFNPGGLLESAVDVADMFISDGLIVATDGRNVRRREWNARSRRTVTDVPLAVLVNRYSASASEVVSACLQDHGRAVIVGERTWGKGSVQNIVELEQGQGAIKLTTASYHRPSGKNIHRLEGADEDDDWGVIPNEGFAIRFSNREISELLVQMGEREVVGQQDTRRRSRPRQEEFTDRQLDRAIEYLREAIEPRQSKAAS